MAEESLGDYLGKIRPRPGGQPGAPVISGPSLAPGLVQPILRTKQAIDRFENRAAQATSPIFNPIEDVFGQIARDIRSDLGALLAPVGRFLYPPEPGPSKSAPSTFAQGRKVDPVTDVAARVEMREGLRQAAEVDRLRREFVQAYNAAELAARNREFTSVPLGYSPTMYEIVTRQPETEARDPNTGQILMGADGRPIMVPDPTQPTETVYRLKEWYKTPLEEAALAVARMDPAEARRTLQDPSQQLLATPAGRRQLKMMSGQEDRYVSTDPTVTSGRTKLLTQEDAIDIVSRMGLNELNELKDNLMRIGALTERDSGTRLYADRTAGTYEAFANLVALAQGNARTWHSVLAEAVDEGLVLFEAGKTTGGAPQQLVRLTAPEDLGAVFGQTALRTIGRRLTDEEKQFMVTTYQDMERSFWRQASGGGEVVDVPSPQSFAETRIPEQMGAEYDVFQMGNVLDDFRRILGGQL